VTCGSSALAGIARGVKVAFWGPFDLDGLHVGDIVNRLDQVTAGAKRVLKGRI